MSNLQGYTCYERALQLFGHLKQAAKCQEELNELGIELSRFITEDKRFNRKKVLEEITDVEIMLKQLKIMFNFTEDDLLEMKTLKVAKLELFLQNSENK